jgi:LysM repeat protein
MEGKMFTRRNLSIGLLLVALVAAASIVARPTARAAITAGEVLPVPTPAPEVVSQVDLDLLPTNERSTLVAIGDPVREHDGLYDRWRIERTVTVTRVYRFVTLLGADYATTYQVPPVASETQY